MDNKKNKTNKAGELNKGIVIIQQPNTYLKAVKQDSNTTFTTLEFDPNVSHNTSRPALPIIKWRK